MGGRFTKIRELVERASDLPAEERKEYLDAECGGDRALREEVELLLESGARGDAFLSPGKNIEFAAVASFISDAPLEPGARVGAFTIIKVLAAGGMGIVYEAEQREPARRVALKMLRRSFDTEAARRFRYEVSVLASLRHPGVAQVYETGMHTIARGGSERRVPWFAMELLENATAITKNVETRNLTNEARLRLFAEVCRAVHYGHQKGVIHRDLKPDNIIIDRFGGAKIIDFGIARATGDDLELTTLETRPGHVMGTLPYMSPEQVAGNTDILDIRSDIYSLGVILYELMTGGAPYALAGRSLPDAARVICDEPPKRPSEIRTTLRGDLETIILKAIDKDPARRYNSAEAFAADVEHYLSHQPIEARPPSVAYQISLFTKRHRWLVAAAASVFIILTIATVVSAVFAVEADKANKTALLKKNEADLLFQTLFEGSTKGAAGFAMDAIRLNGGTKLARAILESVDGDLQKLAAIAPDHLKVQLQLLNTKIELADVLGNPANPNLGDLKGAKESYQSVLDRLLLLQNQFGADSGIRSTLGRAHRRMASILFTEKNYKEALAQGEKSLTIFGELLAVEPGSKTWNIEVAQSHDALSVIYIQLSRFDEARKSADVFVNTFRKLAAADAKDFGLQEKVAAGYDRLAANCYSMKRFEEAADYYKKARAECAPLLAARPDNQQYQFKQVVYEMWEGVCELMLDRGDEAAVLLKDASEAFDKLAAADPANQQIPRMRANTKTTLGGVFYTKGEKLGFTTAEGRAQVERAREIYLSAFELLEAMKAKKPLPPDLAEAPTLLKSKVKLCDDALSKRE